jgi:hypothetical protein
MSFPQQRLKDRLQATPGKSTTRAMPTIAPKRKKACWLRRKIEACRSLAQSARYWGPLAFREVIEDWRSLLAADRKVVPGDGPAEPDSRDTARQHPAEGN